MAKRKRENNNEKKRREGRGEGNFKNYKPWLNIQDVASQGLATRIKGIKTGRCHQLLSTLELDYFYLLDWSEKVIDIREQYPLDLKETLAIAKEADIRHPPKFNPAQPIVMTTDFLITIRQPIGTKDVARTIKYSKDLANLRVLEKLEIERLYWQERKVDWGIVTELDINKTLVKNIKWLYKHRTIGSLPSPINPSQIPEISKYMLPFLAEKQLALRTITKDCDEKFSLSSGHSLAIVRYLLSAREWKVNMLIPIQPEKPLIFLKN